MILLPDLENRMNYEKKRKRQSGRQARGGKTSYEIINGRYWDKVHGWIDESIESGALPAVNFEAKPVFVAKMKAMTQEEFDRDWAQNPL